MQAALASPSRALDATLFANGTYDVLCCISILFLSNTAPFSHLSKLHADMFAEKDRAHPTVRRVLAYWVGTYGVVRALAGAHRGLGLDACAAATYFAEALAFALESAAGNTVGWKAHFVAASSAALGAWTLQRALRDTEHCTA